MSYDKTTMVLRGEAVMRLEDIADAELLLGRILANGDEGAVNIRKSRLRDRMRAVSAELGTRPAAAAHADGYGKQGIRTHDGYLTFTVWPVKAFRWNE